MSAAVLRWPVNQGDHPRHKRLAQRSREREERSKKISYSVS